MTVELTVDPRGTFAMTFDYAGEEASNIGCYVGSYRYHTLQA